MEILWQIILPFVAGIICFFFLIKFIKDYRAVRPEIEKLAEENPDKFKSEEQKKRFVDIMVRFSQMFSRYAVLTAGLFTIFWFSIGIYNIYRLLVI